MARKQPSQRQNPRGLGARPGAAQAPDSAAQAFPKPANPPADPLVGFTTRIPTSLKREVMVRAAETGESLQDLTTRALRLVLAQTPSTEAV